MLMDYISKEGAQSVEVITEKERTFAPYISFEFQDAENRSCLIKLFEASTATTPELVKTMRLYTRIAKKQPPKDNE